MPPKTFAFDPESHVYTLDGLVVPSVTQVLQGAGLVDFSHVSKGVLDRASAFGTAAHMATALEDEKSLDIFSMDPELQGPVDAWNKFKQDIGFIPEIIEIPLYSDKYKFAGTPDRFGMIDKDKVLVDIKTGAMTKATAIQTAGYEILAPYKIKRRIGVQLLMDGTYKVHEYKEKSDKAVFLSALNIFNYKRRS